MKESLIIGLTSDSICFSHYLGRDQLLKHSTVALIHPLHKSVIDKTIHFRPFAESFIFCDGVFERRGFDVPYTTERPIHREAGQILRC